MIQIWITILFFFFFLPQLSWD